MTRHLTPHAAARLVAAAAGGDSRAWEDLVNGYAGLIWTITQNFRLSQGDARDVSQTTWLRLVENVDRLADPSRVGAWLATTTRRECLRVLQQSARTVLVGEYEDIDRVDVEYEGPDAELLRLEETDALRAALQQLPPAGQALLELLLLDPPPSYDEISSALDMPVGSIGPTRGRCLRKLEAHMSQGVSAGV